ncbi:MAG: response regulator transcription factor [Deltaproteobacteria bacterium]|jgi:DNA-binding NarL/FixJ family response regulator|nr:response regulator transcription factor [Deltaproteobacteria bacterium]
MAKYKIILADDHVLIRQGLKKLIEENVDLEVTGEAGDGLELLDLLENIRPDLIILDISMPHLRGIEVINEVKKLCPGVKILMITMHKSEQHFLCAMSAGADGYLLKEDSDSELLNAIDVVMQNEMYISPHLAEEFSDEVIKAYREKGVFPCETLTNREIEVLKLVAEGLTSKEIAEILSISIRTVEHHRANLLKKLNLKNTADLIKHAIQNGFINTTE